MEDIHNLAADTKEPIEEAAENPQKISKFSYSKLNTYESCPFKYMLQYVDHHFIDTSTIASDFGTLVHFIEESIAKELININYDFNIAFDFDKYIDIFINAGEPNYPISDILGAKQLKKKYPIDFLTPDKYGYSYEDKANNYLNFGIYRLYDYLRENTNLEIIGVEKDFKICYDDLIFHGFIDRAFRDKITGDIIIEDIKTWQDIKNHDLVTPLQFVFYTQAAAEIFNVDESKISCSYELPLAGNRYSAGTKGYMNRGRKKINKLLAQIKAKNFTPKPTPLCYWCAFSDTCPTQPEEGKGLCPYRSNWTRNNDKDFSVSFEWLGIENHEAVLAAYRDSLNVTYTLPTVEETKITKIDSTPARKMLAIRW